MSLTNTRASNMHQWCVTTMEDKTRTCAENTDNRGGGGGKRREQEEKKERRKRTSKRRRTTRKTRGDENVEH